MAARVFDAFNDVIMLFKYALSAVNVAIVDWFAVICAFIACAVASDNVVSSNTLLNCSVVVVNVVIIFVFVSI